MEKEQHTAKILEWQVMNKKKNSNSMELVQKQHFSFNSRMGNSPSEVFLKIPRSVVSRSTRSKLKCGVPIWTNSE